MRPFSIKICRICGATTDHARMGVLACRACASFFKRTVTSGRTFICRQGDRSCDVERSSKFLCRFCRYQKCTRLGMRLRGILDRADSPDLPSITQTSPVSLLQRIGAEYQIFYNRRKQREIARHGLLDESIIVRTDSMDLLMFTRDFADSLAKSFGREFFTFASRTFAAFRELRDAEKKLLLRTFWGRLGILECYHYTLRLFPEHDPPKYIVPSRTTCMDLRNFELFFADAADIKNKRGAAETMLSYELKMIRIAWAMFKRTALTDEELHAAIGLMLFEFDDEFPVSLEAICNRVSKQIYTDLGEYYKAHFSPSDCAVRLGNLITLVHVVRESNWLMQEEFQVYSLLDLIESDTYLVDLFLDFTI